MQNNKELFIVFCIDAEGPATEPLQHSFMRLKEIFGVSLEPTYDNLARLQKGDVGGIDDETRLGIKTMFAPDRLEYLNNWEQVSEMLDRFMSERWRKDLPDSYGRGYVYNFFIRDLVGYDYNPRRKPIGYNHIYDFYRDKFIESSNHIDRLYWHYHSPGFVRHAYLDGMNMSHSDYHLQALSRRIIDRKDFPASFRPGMDHIRPDYNLFLEMWIPFDYSNQAVKPTEAELSQKDNAPGRFGDWRKAPQDWIVYHPDHFDYQKSGNMKRYVARCLYTKGRIRQMTQEETDKAFKRADDGQKTVLSFVCHDSRDMTLDIANVNPFISEASKRYPDVKFRYCDAVEAMRLAMDIKPRPPARFEIGWNKNRFEIRSDKELWGPQPFFCFRTWDNQYYHDNLDKQSDTEWTYTFDWQTLDKRAVASIGVASNDDYGNTTIAVWDAKTDSIETEYRNTEQEQDPQR